MHQEFHLNFDTKTMQGIPMIRWYVHAKKKTPFNTRDLLVAMLRTSVLLGNFSSFLLFLGSFFTFFLCTILVQLSHLPSSTFFFLDIPIPKKFEQVSTCFGIHTSTLSSINTFIFKPCLSYSKSQRAKQSLK